MEWVKVYQFKAEYGIIKIILSDFYNKENHRPDDNILMLLPHSNIKVLSVRKPKLQTDRIENHF